MYRTIMKGMLLCAIVFSAARAQKIATITVDLPGDGHQIQNIVALDLDKITYLGQENLALFLVKGQEKTRIPVQVDQAITRTLNWIADPSLSGKLTYELHKEAPGMHDAGSLLSRKANGALIISDDQNDLLAYQYETMFPPAGVDSSYKRSGYIHPVRSPRGQVLTRIQPPDHYHHYGIWNPWTHTLFEKDTVDFWNLNKRQGTVRHDRFLSIQQGAVFNEFRALHEHVVFKKDGTQKVALNELQTVRLYKPQGDSYIVEFTVNLNCASDSPLTLLEYRYGGFGWRATEQWTKDNSEMLSSAGKTRENIDNTPAEWFYVQGGVANEYAGILMMSNPANFNHPQPTRMWGIPQEGPGDVFACFSPTRNTDWPLEPGKTYTLRYRFVVYNGHFDAQIAGKHWQNYIHPAKINVSARQ